METITNLINLVLSMLGITPVQALAVGFNAIMGVVSVPVTNWLKTSLGKVSFLAEPIQTKITGWMTILVSGIVGILLMTLGDKLFGLQILADEGAFATVVAAFGINQTFASIYFEWLKSRRTKPAV